MINVLHLSAGNLYGGVETLLVTLARERQLCPAMRSEFALCFEGRLASELAAAGAQVHLLGPVRTSRPHTVLRARRRLGLILGTSRFQVAVCHSPWPLAVFGPAVRRAGIALVGWRHDAYNGFHWLEWWASLTPPDLMICNSRYTETTYRRFAPKVRTAVVYCPRLPAVARPSNAARVEVRAEMSTPPGDVVIIQVSRMQELKGHITQIGALGALRELPGWTLWVAGGAQREHERRYLERLKALARDLGIAERVRFLGERQDVAKLLAAADIYCQPNTGPEGFGLAFIEALYAGLPVVTSAIGGALEIVDDTCGRLVKPGDPEGLGAVLRNLIADAALRERLGAAGPARAHALCDPQARLEDIAHLLESVGRARSAGRPDALSGPGASPGSALQPPLAH